MNEPTEDELAAQRIASVERQIHAYLPRGFQRRIHCPYCGQWNKHAQRTLLCCDLLRQAVIAVLLADRMLKTAEAGERAMQA